VQPIKASRKGAVGEFLSERKITGKLRRTLSKTMEKGHRWVITNRWGRRGRVHLDCLRKVKRKA